MTLARPRLLQSLHDALERRPVVVLTGPRQCGKTTLARQLLDPAAPTYFDLEDPRTVALFEQPMTALEPLTGLVVIDEVQRAPDLFPLLRVLADRRPLPARFLILGSASGELLRQSSESLAGRAEHLRMTGFTLDEVGTPEVERLWERGGFPEALLATNEIASVRWRRNFIDTLVERDLPQWGVRVASTAMRRFWTMVAHYHAQIWNNAEPARALGVSEPTVRSYLDLLTDALVLRQLQPWHANLRKRQVKSPKVYVRDSGLLHELLGIEDRTALLHHPKLGASWEGFAIEQVLATEPHTDAAFWATHQGAEIDLLLQRQGKLYGVECKRVDAPRMTPSIRNALADLGMERVAVVYPGARRYPLADRVEAVPLASLAEPGRLFQA
ncbi:MAG: ATP-binding protein [Sterolibacteriaceae bacterium]|jgi:predicted AAA+ superfamily ATPase|uniref:ATP-binding protein n=1 Tax=Candidatus Methylophosphatis roskildensis TaxID=2899263 RepID=A0A9D7E4X6_9PROT|nr:ATP-binding protein [Candidatus Methylophosphatis roskildensis]MBK7237634.1 ATP-binding protein [Sterolibacteriaceae bacterium]